MVLAQTIIADVVSPRERGRYQGIFGAVFGVTSVVGPLIGGFIVQHLNWHWIFYINLPIGILALVVTAAVLPGSTNRIRHVVDYWGTLLLAGVASSLVLLTTFVGSKHGWGSPLILGLGGAAIVLLVVFILVEKRAVEPVLPLSLFSNRVFTATSAIGFVVGFAMFGAITYLPQYMQVVRGASPTASGLELLPLMAGLLLTSIVSGFLISRWGRYKIFPILGTATMTIGMYLLSRMGVHTSVVSSGFFMFVLGVGIGGVMQVLVIAVQNAVGYEELGTATAGATFFRSIGGSFGTAVFGAIFTAQFSRYIVRDLTGIHLPPGFSASAGASPAGLATLPPHIHAAYTHAFASALDVVFLVAVPIAAVAFVLSWLLKELPLRKTVQVTNPADTYAPTAMPAVHTSLEELARSLSVLAKRENQAYVYQKLAESAGVDLDVRSCWVLLRLADHPHIDLATLAKRLHVPEAKLESVVDGLERQDLVRLTPAEQENRASATPELTDTGDNMVNRLTDARRAGLQELLGDWSPEQHQEVGAMIARIARDMLTHETSFHPPLEESP